MLNWMYRYVSFSFLISAFCFGLVFLQGNFFYRDLLLNIFTIKWDVMVVIS